jgi:sulfatase maturation enzyme AslB (radical SAM superfamily)
MSNAIKDSKNIQIMQNSNDSSQSMTVIEDENYKKIATILEQLQNNIQQMNLTSNSERELKSVITDVNNAITNRNNTMIHRGLQYIKEILTQVSSNVIAMGIVSLLSQMGI